ncbi:hypothetical protein Brsp05_04565 [Brucella sp. NBRC 12953]
MASLRSLFLSVSAIVPIKRRSDLRKNFLCLIVTFPSSKRRRVAPPCAYSRKALFPAIASDDDRAQATGLVPIHSPRRPARASGNGRDCYAEPALPEGRQSNRVLQSLRRCFAIRRDAEDPATRTLRVLQSANGAWRRLRGYPPLRCARCVPSTAGKIPAARNSKGNAA